MGIGVELFDDGSHDLGVAVADVQHRDATGEIDIALALGVPDLGVFGAGGKDAGGAGDAARHGMGAAFKQALVRHGDGLSWE